MVNKTNPPTTDALSLDTIMRQIITAINWSKTDDLKVLVDKVIDQKMVLPPHIYKEALDLTVIKEDAASLSIVLAICDCADKHVDDLLSFVAEKNEMACVKAFIPFCPADKCAWALHKAARRGHIDCVRTLLLPSSAQSEILTHTLFCAAQDGYKDIAQCLLPYTSVDHWSQEKDKWHWDVLEQKSPEIKLLIQSYFSRQSLNHELIEKIHEKQPARHPKM